MSFASPKLFINSSDRWWTLEARKDGELVSGKIRLILHFRKVCLLAACVACAITDRVCVCVVCACVAWCRIVCVRACVRTQHMDRDEELELELQKVRSAIREEMVTRQKTSGPGGLWAGRPQNQKDDGAGGAAAAPKDQVEKLVRTLNERRQKLEKEVVDRNRERGEPSSTTSSSSSSLSSSSGPPSSSSSLSASLDSSNDKGRTDSLS